MLRENWRLISRIERLGDFLIIVVCFFISYYGRSSLLYWDRYFDWKLPFGGVDLAPLKDYFIALVVSLTSYMVFLEWMGSYSSMRLSSTWRLFRMAITSSFLVFITLSAALFLLKLDLSRSFVALFCSLVALSLAAERYLVLEILRFWRKRGKNFRNVIVCGIGEQAIRFAREVHQRSELGVRVRGFADLRDGIDANDSLISQFRMDLRQAGYFRPGRIIVGSAALEKALKEYAIDEVIFTDIVDVMPAVEEMILICAEQGRRTTIAADLFSLGMVQSGLSYFGGMPLIHFQTPPGDRWELSVKRVIDVVVAGLSILILSPIFIAIALAILISSGRPIFFKQRRVGLNGRLFPLYKFRSMRIDAEAEMEKLKEQNEMSGPAFKLKNDPRVNSVGKFLRRFSLDELPQLWNVIIGDMSLVGPRPPVPGEVSMYERKDRRRLSMRPGMTCTWQVSGRSDIKDFDSWVKLDLEYIDNWSLSNDLILLFRTIPAVILGTGAR